MSKRKPRRDGIVHQIANTKEFSPAPTDQRMPTIDDFKEMLDCITPKGPKFSREMRMALHSEYEPYFGKTKQELEEIIPDGMYQIGTAPWIAMTGKGGLINYILMIQEP